MHPLKGILFALIGAVVAGGAVMAVTGINPLDYLRGEQQVATEPGNSGTASNANDVTTQGATDPDAKADTAISKGDRPVPPVFGLVRVEPDGSLVVAGNAPGDSAVELMSGSTALGKVMAGPGGDFVVVLDDPLKPGDYQLVLRSTANDGTAVTSVETAVVSVPEDQKGDVLALVEQPGEASRLISKPAGEAAPASENNASAGEQTAKAEPAETAATEASKPADEAAKTEVSEESKIEEPKAEEPKTETQTAMATEKPADEAAAGAATDKPAASNAGTDVAAGTAKAEQPADTATQDVAKADPAPEKAVETENPAEMAKPDIFVEAVEIEGRKVFVAGGGTPGNRIRVYANAILLGESEISEGGRFLVEAIRDLPVGDYIIRADVIAKNSADVVARAAVPFERQAGEQVAAVAPQGGSSATAQSGDTAAATGESSAAAPAESDKEPADTAESDAAMEPKAEQPEAMSQDEKAETAPAQAATATGDQDVEKTADTSGTQMAKAETESAKVNESASKPNAPTVEATAPKLQATDASVIIRRGDTLWQISRRVYGRGIRYTTIYLANEAQISDPNRIWPGQIFQVPDKSQEGEAADMSSVQKPTEEEVREAAR